MTAIPVSPIKRETSSGVPGAPSCTHCGDPCPPQPILLGEKTFCCEGCKTVFEILDSNGLCQYYDLDERPGISLRGKRREEYAILDQPDIKARFVQFTDQVHTRITWIIPQIHCASCIWLLENLYKLAPGILQSKVNFQRKELAITFREDETSLRRIAELLADVGYAPAVTLSQLEDAGANGPNRALLYKIGVAGFAFGNIMLLSFPEYLGLDAIKEVAFARYFNVLNIFLALPVLLYSAQDYFVSAWKSLRRGALNIDVPLALGAAVLFLRSIYEIAVGLGPGYLDSLAGLIFFLLTGKWFQQRTFDHISFERDYKSYFPISARRKTEQGEELTSLEKIQAGDTIVVRHGELIPADATILVGEGLVDYSFVTGEEQPVAIPSGSAVFAGGRQMGGALELQLTRGVSQSYLTQLWNEDIFSKKQESPASILANRISRYFTIALLVVALGALIYWWGQDRHLAFNAFTAVLIVACPCAGALAVPFTLGNALRILGRQRFYLKNTNAIEALYRVNAVVLDKTGTLTTKQIRQVEWRGAALLPSELEALWLLAQQSAHPLSQAIAQYLGTTASTLQSARISQVQEVVGRGVQGLVDGVLFQLGSRAFIPGSLPQGVHDQAVLVAIAGQIKGGFVVEHTLRAETTGVLEYLQSLGPVHLLSGDNDREASFFAPLFGGREVLHFQQSPQDKLQFVRQLQADGAQVLMMGDGLNDAGALKQSNMGIVISEDTNNFSPASDGILSAQEFSRLPQLIGYARHSVRLVFWAYLLALAYNVIGLSFAVQGLLAPVVAAILMPISSISVVIFGTVASNLVAQKYFRPTPGAREFPAQTQRLAQKV